MAHICLPANYDPLIRDPFAQEIERMIILMGEMRRSLKEMDLGLKGCAILPNLFSVVPAISALVLTIA